MSATPRLSSHERREAIVDAAIRLFSEKGFRGTTTRELAAAVGVSEPILYQHFATKRDLYDAIIDAKSMDGEKICAQIRPYLDGRDDRGFFSTIAEIVLAWHAQDPSYLRLLLFSALEGHDLTQQFYERYTKGFMQMLADYIRRRIREGAFRAQDPVLAMHAFVGMVAHYGLDAALSRRLVDQPRNELVDSIVNIFLEGIQAR